MGTNQPEKKKHKTNERGRNENLRTYFTQTRKEGEIYQYINLNQKKRQTDRQKKRKKELNNSS